MYRTILVFMSVLVACKANTIPQTCPDATPMENFDFDKFAGTWIEVLRYPNHFEKEGRCIKEVLIKIEDGKMQLSQVTVNPKDSSTESVNGTLRLNDLEEQNGHLKIKYDSTPHEFDYMVLNTDFDNYAVIWSCTPLHGGRKMELAWVLARNKMASDSPMMQDISRFITDQSPIQRDKLTLTEQNCNF